MGVALCPRCCEYFVERERRFLGFLVVEGGKDVTESFGGVDDEERKDEVEPIFGSDDEEVWRRGIEIGRCDKSVLICIQVGEHPPHKIVFTFKAQFLTALEHCFHVHSTA